MTENIAFLPLGFSREENGGASLSPVKGTGAECPKCGDGYIGHSVSKNGSWGFPESPTTVYCTECGTKYELGLREVK